MAKTKEQIKVEKIFRKKIKLQPSEELIVLHKVDQWQLFQTLQDTTIDSIFWVSHGVSGKDNQTVEGATLLPKLLDFRGDNLAAVFNLMREHLKFISIIGCNSEKILDHYSVDTSRIAHYIPVKRKVAAHIQIRKAIDEFRRADLTIQREPQAEELIQGQIQITRNVEANQINRSLRVYAGNKLLGLLPATSSSVIFGVPENVSLKIRLESGQDPSKTQAEFGHIEISSDDIRGRWDLFTSKDGLPFGVNHRLFIYRF